MKCLLIGAGDGFGKELVSELTKYDFIVTTASRYNPKLSKNHFTLDLTKPLDDLKDYLKQQNFNLILFNARFTPKGSLFTHDNQTFLDSARISYYSCIELLQILIDIEYKGTVITTGVVLKTNLALKMLCLVWLNLGYIPYFH